MGIRIEWLADTAEDDEAAARLDLLRDRLRRVHARGRIADSILGVALDALEPYASDYLASADYQRLCRFVDGPVAAATDRAIESLLEELAAAIDDADPDLAGRFRALRIRQALPLD